MRTIIYLFFCIKFHEKNGMEKCLVLLGIFKCYCVQIYLYKKNILFAILIFLIIKFHLYL